MKKIICKFLYCLILLTILMNFCGGLISNAVEITSADLVKVGDADYHLKYFQSSKNAYTYLICTVVGHYIDGKFYPAYCMNSDLQGVTENYSYSVSINEIINRDDVWRVVKNGYPYKTPQEMGVANEFDAFAVTKFAVYCLLGEASLSKFHAEPNDAEAVAMLNALNNLVNIGRNGTESRTTGNFSISKVDDLAEEGNYVYQKYKVSSNLDMKEINISIANGLPEGSYISKIDDSSFKLYIPKSKLNTNINGELKISGKSRTYPIFYGESGNPNTQDYVITYDSFGDVTSNCKVEITTNTGKLKIVKTDSDTNKPISDVTFKLVKPDGSEVGRVTTNENGEAIFDKLFQGTYKLVEVQTNQQYILDDSEREVSIYYNQLTQKDVTNKHKEADLKVYKVDKDNNKITLGNVKFDLYSDEFQKVIGTYTTDVNGEIEIKNLRTGNYKLIEKNTGKWYNLADSQEIEVKWNEVNENIIENELKKGQIKIIKVDKDNNEVKLRDVKFNILNDSGEVLETIVTDENGEALTSRYAVRDFEKLVFQEIETNEFYKLNDEPQTIVLQENEITTVKFENEAKKGQIKVIKVDKDKTEVKLANVTFDVLNSKGDIIETLTTDENGEAITSKLPINDEYTLRETATLENYVLSDEIQTVTLEEDQIKDITFKNEKKKGKIKVIKVEKDNTEVKLKNVKFGIYDKSKNLIETLVTDENGEAISQNLAIDEDFTIKELETGKEYILNNDEVKVELKENEITTLTFENELKKGRVQLVKFDKDTSFPIKNVEFELYDSKNTLIGTYITDKEGKIEVENLKIGDYYFKETRTDESYNLLSDIIKFDVRYNETTKLSAYNEKIKNRFKIIKVDKEDNGIRLEGVKFEVFDEKSNLLETLVTDKNGEAYSAYYPIINRIYTIHEVSTIPGYERNDEYLSFKLDKDKIIELIIENKKIPEQQEEKEEEQILENTVSEIKVLPRTGY